MAERRMFSKRIIGSAKFLKMPLTTQALYFHLGLNADDDGIVEAWNVLKTVGCTEDDLRVLVAKEFVQVLNEDLVTYILDWNENNRIRPDRKIDSIYKGLLLSVVPDVQLIEKRERADKKDKVIESGQPMDNQWTTNGQPMDRIGKDSIGKDSIGKDNKKSASETTKKFIPPTLEGVKAYCQERQNSIDPEAFIDFYASKGWMVGKNKMKDWRACVRTWEKRDNKQPEKKTKAHNFTERTYTDEDFKRLEGLARN